VDRRLGRHGEDQAGEERAQVPGRREHQEPASAAAGKHHADAEERPADQRAGERAARGELAGFGNVDHAKLQHRLGEQDGGGEGDEPDGHLDPDAAAGELDDAARRQKRLRCAKMPKAMPIASPPSAEVPGSPKISNNPVRSMARPALSRIRLSTHSKQ
jgi:hypothetical protein